MPINIIMLAEEIVFADAATVNNYHCEEFDDPFDPFDRLRAGVAIGVQLSMTYRAGQQCPRCRRRCLYRVIEYCHVVELLAMTKGRALPVVRCSL